VLLGYGDGACAVPLTPVDERPPVNSSVAAQGARCGERKSTLFDEPGSAGERLQLRRGCLNLSDAATWTGHYGQARRFVRQGRALGDTGETTVYADLGVAAGRAAAR
jgi:hypothetical protein